jgi:adenylosuccinate lyase
MIERYSLSPMKDLWTNQAKWDRMLQIELLICEAWNKKGLIPDEDLKNIMEKASFSPERILEIEAQTHHDVVAFVSNVAENIGSSGKYFHLGATSSDILDTCLSWQLKDASTMIIEKLELLSLSLKKKALEYKTVPCIGRTHGVHAEPSSFGLKFASWYSECKRNIQRMQVILEEVTHAKLSGAVGNYANTDPFVEAYVLEQLKLTVAPVATQVVSRDTHAHYLSTLALIASCLDRFTTEIRHLQRTEVQEASEPFGQGQKGSSAMPHKRNPILCERITGMARVMRGYASASMENIPLWHERDISHSSAERIIIPDASILLDYMLHTCNRIIDGLTVNQEQALKNIELTWGACFSQGILSLLISYAYSRDEAYALIQKTAFQAFQEKRPMLELLKESKELSTEIPLEKLEKAFDLEPYLRYVDDIFKRIGVLA